MANRSNFYKLEMLILSILKKQIVMVTKLLNP